MVASGIISPIMSPIVNNALEFVLERTGLQKALSEGSKLNNELEEQFLIENYIKAGYGVGVSSGDNEPLGVKESLYWDEEQLDGIRDDINKVAKYVENEIDNICEKANLSKEEISWGRENKVEAAKAITKWSIENPQEALSIGIDVAVLFPLFKQLKLLKPMVTPQENLVFLPGGGFKLVEPTSKPITMSKFEESKGGSKFDYKGIIENKTGVSRDIPKKHIDHLSQLEATSKWPELGSHMDLVPEGYKLIGYTEGKKTTGLVFKKSEHNEIAIKKAKLDSDFPSQQVDYVSYKVDGNKYVTRKGDYLSFDANKDNIIRIEHGKDPIVLPKEELKMLGISRPQDHPDVHIPINEAPAIFKLIESKK